jgi:hypothetical protein
MIILSDNPLNDIRNANKIEAVISDGQFVNSRLNETANESYN